MEEVRNTGRQGPPWYRSTRYLIAVLACFMYCNLFALRVNFSMAVVCMVNHTAVGQHATSRHPHPHPDPDAGVYGDPLMTAFPGNSSLGEDGPSRNNASVYFPDVSSEGNFNDTGGNCESEGTRIQSEDGELVWGKGIQGIMLGAFYWGYTALQLPAQRIVHRFGSKRAVLVCLLLMSTFTALGPVTARLHHWLFILTRIAIGLGSAIMFPSVYAIWGNWAPRSERTALISICCSGSYLANIVVFPTSGLLCRHGFAGGWPSVFYVYAIFGYVWCLLWSVFFYESPATHPWISEEEKSYILENTEQRKQNTQDSVPWLKIITSVPVWALIIAQLGYNWCTFLFLSVLPQYMREVLKQDIQSNGVFTMLPHVCLFLTTNTWGAFTSWMIRRKSLSTLAVRKLSTFIGDLIPSALFIVVSYLSCDDYTVAIVLITAALGIGGTNLQGFLCNPYDVGTRFATAIISFSNTISVVTGIISPYLVSALTNEGSREEWQIVFFVTAGICTSCMLFFLLAGSAHEMAWVKDWDKTALEIELSLEEEGGGGGPLKETSGTCGKPGWEKGHDASLLGGKEELCGDDDIDLM